MNQKDLNSQTRHNINQAAALEKAREREAWFKVVVKVLSWRDGPTSTGVKILRDKITDKEWKLYSRRKLQTNITFNREQLLQELREMEQKIKSFGGFEID